MAQIGLIEDVASTQHGVATAVQCRRVGVSEGQIRRLCRSGRWLRLNRGAYYVAAHDGSAPRIAHIQFVLRPDEITRAKGIPVTTAARRVADVVLRVDRFQAVAVLDSCLNRRVLLPEDLDGVRLHIAGRRGAARARPWFDEVDSRAESPLETRVRLRAADGGLTPDDLQFRVIDRNGQIVAITDFAWLGARVIGGADGASVHDTPAAVFRDRQRQNAIVAAGYHPVRFTWNDTLTATTVPRTILDAITRFRN